MTVSRLPLAFPPPGALHRCRIWLARVVALLVVANPDAVRGDEPAVAPPVEELVREALQHAPQVAAGRASIEAAQELEQFAGSFADPALELMIQDAGFPDWTVGEEEMSMIGPQITQDLPFPGKLGARRAAAAAKTIVRERELQSLRRNVALEVRQLYAEMYALDEELESLDASRDLINFLSAAITHHVESGDMDQEAAVKVRLLGSRIEERRTDLYADRSDVLAKLNRLLDRSGGAPLGVVTSLPRPESPPAVPDSVAEIAAAEVVERVAGSAAAERSLRAARLDLWPDFMTTAGVGFRGKLDPVVSLRFGIEVPLWRGKSTVRAAAAEAQAARHELRDARALARAEATRLQINWQRANEQVLRYEQSFVPQTSLAFDAARSSYLGRRGDFSNVVEDLNLWIEARAGLARREAERYSAWAALEALVHDPPEDEASAGVGP